MRSACQFSMNRSLFYKLAPVLRRLRRYHEHRVVGLENIPRAGSALLVVNHSLATYDIFLLAAAIWEHTGRLPRGLGDRLIFKIPGLRDWISQLGGVEGSPENGRMLLDAGELVLVAPGGMREALRPSSERYQLRWHKRRGFARLAIQAHVPVILAACPRADDLYTVYPSLLTKLAYRRFRLPLPLMRGQGWTALPRPVALTHYLSPPLMPPPPSSPQASSEQAVSAFYNQMLDVMNDLMARGLRDSRKHHVTHPL